MNTQLERDPVILPGNWASGTTETPLEEVVDILPERVEIVPGWTLEEILEREG